MKSFGLTVLFLSTIIWTGCTANLDTRRFQTSVIRGTTPEEAFQTAQVIMRREFGPILADASAGRIDALPSEYQTSSDSGTARDLYRGRSTMRRSAHFSVHRHAQGAIARLRIDIERQDTERQEAFQADRQRLGDSPSQTPIERDAATTMQQNTVWTFVRRDTRLERALLSELQEKLAPPPDDMPPQAAPESEPPATNP